MLEGAVATAEPVSSSTPVETSVNTESSAGESSQSTGAEATGERTEGTEPAEGEQRPTGKFDPRAAIKDPAKREALRAIDPSLPGFIRDAAFAAAQIQKAGGLEALLEDRKFIAEAGGREAFEEVKGTASDYEALDQKYTEGSPDFVKQIAQSDPEAFARMVPHALEQFAAMDPEMYNHVQSRIFVNTFDGVGLSNALKTLLNVANDEAKPGIKEILDWAEGFRSMAAKVPEKKVDAREEAITRKEQEFAQRQAQALTRQVDSESIKHRDSIIEREIKPFGDWDTMDPDRRGAVASWISQRIGRTLSVDRGFMERRERLIAAGDQAGLAKLEQSKLNELVPKLVPQAAKVFGVSKAAAKPGQQAQKTATGGAKPQAKGVMLVKAPPPINTVDREATKRLGLAFNNQAKLLNGQIVQWA